MSSFIVVGAGQAAQSLATRLREIGFDGDITIFGEEPVPPYQRPPLSKKYLLGELEVERLFLRPESFYAEHGIELCTSAAVEGIDPQAREITVGGRRVGYDKLALTTGSVPRRLPAGIGGALGGVYTVRTLADVDAMAHEFAPGRRLLVIGGGYIGLEAAAVAATRGLRVTLVEAADRILQRVAAAQTADVVRAAHQEHGVDVREGVVLERLVGNGRVAQAVLGDGSELEVDFVVVGVGVTPAQELAEAAGLTVENGIRTDEFCRTSDPHIWAAGDCASFPFRGGRVRLESVGNAIDMGECVAENMAGNATPYRAKPWFWSDQYDLKLQIAGLNTGYDHVSSRPGEANRAASFWYYRGPELLAVDAVNDPRAYMVGKRLIEAGRSPSPDLVADPATDLKALLKGG